MITIRSMVTQRFTGYGSRVLLTFALAVVALFGTTMFPIFHAKADISARNLPPNGKIAFFIGQDSDTLSDYKNVLNANPSIPQPYGVTLYTNIVLNSSPGALAGVYSNTNYGAGNINFPATLQQYPNAALAVGLYLSDSPTCTDQPLRAIIGTNDSDVTSGNPNLITQYRQKVDQLINTLKGYNRPVFLRIGYEFDNPFVGCYNATYYVEAFQYIKGRIDALGATNVATVWQASLWPRDEHPDHPEYHYNPVEPNHFDIWYPGDQYVDWVGASVFFGMNFTQYQWANQSYTVAARDLQNNLLNFARSHGKPVMIAESSPQGYDNANQTASSIFVNQPTQIGGDGIWNSWYQDYFNFINSNKDVIRAVAYINTQWNSQPSWQCAPGATAGAANCAQGYWGDARIQANSTIFQRFTQNIECNTFVNGTVNCGGGGGGVTPTPTSGGGGGGNGANIPGNLAANVGAVSNGQTLSYTVNASASGAYYIRVTASSSQQSRLLGFSVDGNAIGNAAFGPGSATIGPPDFNLSSGRHTISVTALSDSISIASIDVYKR